MRGLEAEAAGVLDRRLARKTARPVAVALSGGGDSLALTLIADAWARAAGRELLILTVDHRLQAGGAGWTQACAGLARRLGRPFRALAWDGPKPATGLPAAARAARHRLLAEAAHEAGARVVLMGHTADDIAEARAMRAAGSATPEPREWAPSPAWPEGRGVFLLRPLLGLGRGELRDWLAARGEAWIEDPANQDPRFARARARAAGAQPVRREEPEPLWLAEAALEAAGVLSISRERLRRAPPDEVRRFAGLAAVCAGGGARPPRPNRTARAAEAMAGPEPFVGTLVSARIEADVQAVRIFREAGEAARGGLARLGLASGRATVWDGRFEVAVVEEGLEVRRLAGLAARLPKDEQARLRQVPVAARGALPALVDSAGAVSCPILSARPRADIRSLVGERLRAAAGLVENEPP